MTTRIWSTRWRVIAPLSAVTAVALRGDPANAAPATPLPSDIGPLASLLALTPQSATGSDQSFQLATYADLTAQLAALGVEVPASVEDPALDDWIRAISPLTIPDPFAVDALLLTRELIGFDLTDVDRVLQAGEPPELTSLLRGRFDRDALAAAWRANGYHSVEVDGVAVASISEDGMIDVENPIQRIVLSRMNNAAILPDGTLAYTATLYGMRGIIATVNGRARSLGERIDVAAILAGFDTVLASAMLVPGSALAASQQSTPDLGSQDADAATVSAAADQGAMPPVLLALFGSTPGGPLAIRDEGTPTAVPTGEVVIRLLLAEPGSAERAKQAIEQRLPAYRSARTSAPITDYFASWDVRALPAGNLLELRLEPTPSTPVDFWLRMFAARDLGFLAW